VVSDTAPEQVTEMPAAREFTFELADPQAQLLEEIANPALHRKDVMMTYALAIRQDLRTDGEPRSWPGGRRAHSTGSSARRGKR
jgi:hypothetical protein